jgi:hypothetical protein
MVKVHVKNSKWMLRGAPGDQMHQAAAVFTLYVQDYTYLVLYLLLSTPFVPCDDQLLCSTAPFHVALKII